MSILKNPEQAIVPVNQPVHFPTFYFIPETSTIPSQHPVSNNPVYHQPKPTSNKPPQITHTQSFLIQEKELFIDFIADVWSSLKNAGRDTVRFLARWVILPLSVTCALWVPAGNPAELLL
jgi:hypothetical protein